MSKHALIENAHYILPEYPPYRGNPFIEALPPILSLTMAGKLLKTSIDFQPEYKQLPIHIRLHALKEILFWRQPTTFQLDLEQRFSVMIRTGYRGRNPLHKAFWDDVISGRQSLTSQSLDIPRSEEATSTGFAIVGDSGTGKSCAVRSVLLLYPQLIIHKEYNQREFSRLQIVYIIIQCPEKGGLVALCHNFFRQVDQILRTNYFDIYTRKGRARLEEMIGGMYTVAQTHGIGVMVIDEIQNLTEAKANDAEAMLNFFVRLVNDLCLPIVPVGTPKAIEVLSKAFRQARRLSGQGDLIVKRMKFDKNWDFFVKKMWEYQYILKPALLTPELSKALYYESQGITDLVVKVFILAQIRSMNTTDELIRETLTKPIIHSVKDSLTLLQPMLKSLRANNESAMAEYKDLYDAINIDAEIQQALLQIPVVTETTSQFPVNIDNLSDSDKLTNLSEINTANKQSTDEIKQPKNNRNKKSAIVYKGGLLDIIIQGKSNNIPPSEALAQAGYMRDLTNYL